MLHRIAADARSTMDGTRDSPREAALLERMVDAYLLGRLAPAAAHAMGNELQVVLALVEPLASASPAATARRRVAMLGEAAAAAGAWVGDLATLARAPSRRDDAAAQPFADALLGRAAALSRLAGLDEGFVAEIAPPLREAPPSPQARLALERLLGCLMLRARAIAGPGATARLRVDGCAASRVAVLRLALELVGGAAVATVASGRPEGTDLALLEAFAAHVGATLAHEARADGGATLAITLPIGSRSGS